MYCLVCCQALGYIQNSLVAASPERQFQTFFALEERSVDENVDRTQQFQLFRCALQEGFESVAGVGCYFISLGFQ